MTAGAVWAIVLAAGGGTRFGAAKQFEELGGRRLVDWSMEAARASCDGTVLVLPPGLEEAGAVTGGATRSASVRAGLAAVPAGAEIVVVQDAARPFSTIELWQGVVAAVRAGADAAIPVVPLTDTVKRVDGTTVAETLDRSVLVGVQTPQAFRAGALRDAHSREGEATDDAALVEAIGGKVVTVVGDQRNFKVTTVDDLVIARALITTRP